MKKIICHGDSLTQGADLNERDTWPALVAKTLHLDVINTGISGDTTGGMLGRFYASVIEKNPDVVLITGGTNDLWWALEANTVLANMFTMACQAEHHGIVPVLGLPIPICREKAQIQDFMAPLGGYDRCAEKLKLLVRELKRLALENDIPVLDFYHLFLDEAGEVITDYFLEDGLHANKKGHLLMAEKAVELLRSLLKSV